MAKRAGKGSNGNAIAKAVSQISPSSNNLPKGGGAIHRMGEKCAANLVTDTGLKTVPIATLPGRSVFGPQRFLH